MVLKKEEAANAERDAKARTIVLTLNDDELSADVIARRMQLEPEAAARLVKRLRKQIAGRAAVDRRAALGENIARLNEIFKIAIQSQDAKSALAAQRELNKSQSLYNLVEDKEREKTDREKEAAREILNAALGADFQRVDEAARAVVFRLIAAETKKAE